MHSVFCILRSTELDLLVPQLVFSCVHCGITYTVMTRVTSTNMKETLMHGDMIDVGIGRNERVEDKIFSQYKSARRLQQSR